MQTLEQLLDPISSADFFASYWDERALHIPGTKNKFAGWFDLGSWQRHLGGDLKAAFVDKRGTQREIAVAPGQIETLFVAGMTVCADVSSEPTLAPRLAEFRRAFDMPGGPAFAKLYASNHGGGFALHFDKFHVFVLQLAGKKQWRFSSRPIVPAPLQPGRLDDRGNPVWDDGARLIVGGKRIDAPTPDALDSAVLEEGHCLYLPPGSWHVARAEGHSIAVSLSPPRSSIIELFSRALADELEQKPEWRRDLLSSFGEPPPQGAIPASVASALDARKRELATLVSELDPRLLHRLWQLNVAVSHAGAASVRPRQDRPSKAPLDPGDTLERAGEPLHFVVAPSADGGEELFFYREGGEWTLPLSMRAFLTEVGRQSRFHVAEAAAWAPSLTLDEVREVLAQLVESGVLVRR